MGRAGHRIFDSDLDLDVFSDVCFMARQFTDKYSLEPGRAQFRAALDNYTSGAPHNFKEPSCFTCGKTEAHLGFAPEKCKRCECALYCTKDCRDKQADEHENECLALEEMFSGRKVH